MYGSGILCFRYNTQIQEYELLLVSKNYSEDFKRLITGKYNNGDINIHNLSPFEALIFVKFSIKEIYMYYFERDRKNRKKNEIKHLEKLINNISTKYEKFKKYISTKHHLETNNMYDLYLLLNAKNINSNIIEIPKGHLKENESFIDGAIREFKEETLLQMDTIKVYENINKTIDIIYDANNIYTLNIYLAKQTNDTIDKKIIYNDHDEILYSRWYTEAEIEHLNLDKYNRDIIYYFIRYLRYYHL